ncbi:glycoside hydrolase family 43 protein [Georgenia sp. TF02-10]|uniref:glycoside hydrolase family 43 protein n=1 Tax=Georgenia sp. TF02-10 TaxID=2917725 RepID=UPI001FA80C60|nr:glycoside hydrolase family 43 protein [Georgenia sp. TF02-10]UNX55608.1 glycoside hydrolase family 43 protein [Georgenia sp. TF02-10]
MLEPVHDGYLADPFVLRLPDGTYAAYGSGPPPAEAHPGARAFDALWSATLESWEPRGPVLERLPADLGEDYWAPEVAVAEGGYWMYYSVGHGDHGHHLRVARGDGPFGPFRDLGRNLTPEESFAIDAHPFRDDDGRWYLFFARDILDAERPGTHLAVAPMTSMTELGPTTAVLAPNADWQVFQHDRQMYGRRYTWHTLEGPSVVRRHGRYWLTYSGGAWTGPAYAVSWATADHPLGPWRHAPAGTAPLLRTRPGLVGPGHNSLTTAPDGSDVIAFHAWDAAGGKRQMYLERLVISPRGLSVPALAGAPSPQH